MVRGSNPHRGKKFLFSNMSRLALGSTQPPVYWQWSFWGLKLTNSGAYPIPSLLAVKWLRPEADQLWGPPNPLFTGSEVAGAWSWPAVGPTQSPLYWQWSGFGLKLTSYGAHQIPCLLAVNWLGPEADQLWGPPNPLFTGIEVAGAWSWPAVGPTQSPVYWQWSGFGLTVKWLLLDSEVASAWSWPLLLSAEINSEWCCASTKPTRLCDMYRDDTYCFVMQWGAWIAQLVQCLGYGWDDEGFESQQRQETFLIKIFRPALEPTQPPCQYSRTFSKVNVAGGWGWRLAAI